jgi:aminoglycoside phosphotransferase family enzyme
VCSLEEKVAFLSRPEAYPGRVKRVETKQTHRSWVFLTEAHAWKLKKPVRTEYLDFSTPEARLLDSEEEVRLNQRLAPDVYRGIVPLTVGRQGNLQLNVQGKPVDWLVFMRRLPSDRMLDEIIGRHSVSEADVLKLASVLVAFYKNAPSVRLTGPQYRHRLSAHLEAARNELSKPDYRLPLNLAESATSSQLEFLRQNPTLFDSRAEAGKIIDAHGDLRPEHICMEQLPVIIDCLEFNRNLRTLDAASELTFLALESARLGAPRIGEVIFKKYREETGDRPKEELLAFYKGYHACIRAKIAIWHLKDDSTPDQAIWIAKATHYLNMVAGFGKAA